MLRRAASAAILAALVGLLQIGAPAAGAAAGPKVVIVVGAVESVTPSFRRDADAIYTEAIKYTSNVVRIYSPNATWAKVKAAAQGASVFVYLGHGYGFPSPYKPILTPSVHDGMGLNAIGGVDDWDKKYYGESYVASEIRLAKNAIVILNHLCYSAGSSEDGQPQPTIAVAKQRVDNFASGFLRAGARAVMADSYTGNAIGMVRAVFSTHQSIDAAWHGLYGGSADIKWAPLRNPAYTSIMRPDTATAGFHRAITGNLALTTDEVVAGAAAGPTNVVPTALQAPGAAVTGASGAALFADSALTAPALGNVPAGTTLRVAQLVPAAVQADGTSIPPAAEVATLDGATTGWTDSTGLAPRDSTGPQLWSLDGLRTLSPNFDGRDDRLDVVAWFSESVSWSVRISDPAGALLKTHTGTGFGAAITWDPVVGGAALPDGDYGFALRATDAWGNAPLEFAATITVANAPIPPTAVPTFAPTATLTNAATVRFNLRFAGAVTGLSAADFTITGSTAGCVVAAPVAADATQTAFTVDVGSCGTGRLVLSLEPGTVTAVAGGSGPAGLIVAPAVTIDRTVPKATAPVARVRAGVTQSSSIAVTLGWSASDTGGAGIRTYEIGRSVDGGAYTTIATGLTTASLNASVSLGHTYRYRVRASDKAANWSTWVAGPTLSPGLAQQTSTSVTWSGTWTTVSATGYSGGSARSSGTAAASATYAFSGRSIGLLFSRGPTKGQAKVYVDGAYSQTIDLYAATVGDRFVAYSRTFGSYGAHSIRVVVVGTAGHPTLTLDAFLLLR